MASIPRVAFFALLCATVPLGGCGNEGGPPEEPSLDEVRKFDGYSIYYAGDAVAGHELESIAEEKDYGRNPKPGVVGYTFTYGDCEPPGGLFAEGGCSAPIQIQNYSICDRNLGMYRGAQEVLQVRGAKGATNGGGLEIFTGSTTLVIFALDDPSLIGPTVRRLRRVGQDAPPPRLPPPAPGRIWGKPPC
jgi:hypothetical protein